MAKDIVIFFIVMLLSLGPSLLKAIKEEKAKSSTPKAPKPKPEPYFPDADNEPRPAYAPSNASRKSTIEEDYFSYETIPDEQPIPKADTSKQAGKSAGSVKSSPVIQQASEQPNVDISLTEEEIFKGIVYSEILKRKYI
ncbi:MAG: hypothetical protein IKU03_01085 [Bacteroidales bacterium]|nr:hypothetical protein [Bacteroidales bacterium]